MGLRAWPLWRIILIWVAWPVSLALVLVATATVIVWRSEARPVSSDAILPPQYSDFRFQVGSIPVALLVWVGPPLLLTLLWLWRRRATT